MAANAVLLSPRGSGVGTPTNDESYSSEAHDQLPSLPSSSSSLFMAINTHNGHYNHDGSQHNQQPHRRRRRVASLYGDASVAASDTISIEGTSTYEYDVVSNIHKQQARRQRGDSNASISTVASVLSRHPSVADSLASVSQAYQRDGYARGHFVGNRSAASSIRGGNDDDSDRDSGNGYGVEYKHGDAAASLRRIRKASGLGGSGASRTTNAATSAQPPQPPHLTDKLERLIANSSSYRAAQARRSLGRTDDNGGSAAADGALGARHRKNSYASIRSLMAFTPTNHRQTATGTYQAPSSSRAASLFGVFIGNDSSSMRAPSWSRPVVPSAPILSSVDTGTITLRSTNGGASTSASSSATGSQQRDAIGSLRGLRGLFDVPPGAQSSDALSSSRAPPLRSRPALLTRNTTGGSSLTTNTATAAKEDATTGKNKQLSSPKKEQRPSERQRHVSFQSGMPSNVPPSSSQGHTLANISVRRAFSSIDPTTNGVSSGTATPGTARSISPPLNGSRVNSHVDLSHLAATSATALAHHSNNSSNSNLAGTGHHSPTSTPTSMSGSGAMPALDEALARAEDRSGLKTSSRCATCGKRVVNAPVTKTGEVFCSRDCRIAMKQRRREADKKAQAEAGVGATAAASTSTPPAPVSPPQSPKPSPSDNDAARPVDPSIDDHSAGHAITVMPPAITT